MREQMRAIRETIEGLCKIGLEHGPRRDVDLAPKERLESRGATREEMDLEPPKLRRPEDIVLEGGEGDAARKPGRDGKRSRVYRLSRVCGALRRGNGHVSSLGACSRTLSQHGARKAAPGPL